FATRSGICARYGDPSGFLANRLMLGSTNVTAKNGDPGPCGLVLLSDRPKNPPTERSRRGFSDWSRLNRKFLRVYPLSNRITPSCRAFWEDTLKFVFPLRCPIDR